MSFRPGSGWQLDQFDEMDVSQCRIVWNRRRSGATVPAAAHPDDRSLIQHVSNRFLEEFRLHLEMSGAHTKWINAERAQLLAESKAYQLDCAHQLGFPVPDSLISNNPRDITAFVAKVGNVVVKGLQSMAWSSDADYVALPTSRLTSLDGVDDRSLSMCPMIYQRSINRSFDARVVVMGEAVVAVAIRPGAPLRDLVDWRPRAPADAELAQIEPPETVANFARALTRRLGLIHAVIDFGVAPDGEWHFFEVNCQGQWLWMERFNPDIRLLGPFLTMMTESLELKASTRKALASCRYDDA